MTATEVLNELRTNPSYIKKIMVYAAKIRSTKPYWHQRCGELLDMISQLGAPSIFFTLSAADYHWPDLFRILAPGRDPEDLTSSERRKLMHDNFDIADFLFTRRCELYFKLVLRKIFLIDDEWYRYEYQWRGSPHLHGLLWLKDAPDIDPSPSEEEIRNIKEYFGRLCSAWNFEFHIVETENLPRDPESRRIDAPPENAIHCCRKRFSEIPEAEYETDLAYCLNTFQRHSCDTRCLRKFDHQMECRFHFPFELSIDDCRIEDEGKLKFYPQRNDRYLAKHNPFMTVTFRSNTDCAPVIDMESVSNYIAKYASKDEKSSISFQELLELVAAKLKDDSLGETAIRAVGMSFIGARNYSAQETSHVAHGLPFYHSSRQFVTLCIDDGEWQHVTVNDSQQLNFGKKLVDKYRSRPQDLPNMNLLHFAKNYYTEKRQGVEHYVHRRREAIVRLFPRHKLSADEEHNEQLYRLQVVLNVPFRQENYSELLRDPVTDQVFETWRERCVSLNLDVFEPLEFPEVEDEGEAVQNINEEDQRDPFMVLAGMMNTQIQLDGPRVGKRLMDDTYDWLEASNEYPRMDQVNRFLRTYQNAIPQRASTEASDVTLSREQQRVLDICKLQIDYHKTKSGNPPKHVVVMGQAGSGKSTLINAIVDLVKKSFPHNVNANSQRGRQPDHIKVAAPTGVAALNVSGQTIHSLLHIMRTTTYEPLDGKHLQIFMKDMEHVKFFILDEMSMISANMLYLIERRCRQARPGCDEPFGGIMVYFFGDFRQLPPVAAPPLYPVRWANMENVVAGRMIFWLFQKFCNLRQCHRQQGSDQEVFRSLLNRLWKGQCTIEDHQLLMTRRRSMLSAEELKSFENAICLYTTNKGADKANDDYLERMGVPVARIVSLNHPGIPLDEYESTMGLNHVLNLAVGCRVMLRTNLWVQGGLVNSSLGTVKAIVYDEGNRPPALPMYVLVDFDDYKGDCLVDHLFPIKPITRTLTTGSRTFMRTQLPLSVGHAFTIHKSQGLTIPKVIIGDLGTSEKTDGMTYVALTRVKKLEDLMFEKPFPLSRLTGIANAFGHKERTDFINEIIAKSDADL